MILAISFRTDIVAQYAEWLADTLLNKEYIGSRNSYNNVVQLFPTKNIEGIIFCSKNYSNLLPYIKDIDKRYHCRYHYTITPYGGDIEPNIPTWDESWETLIKLEQIVGSDKIIWRYDPILLTENYTKHFIIRKFDEACENFSNHFNMCTFNFVNVYDKVKKNFPELEPPSQEDMDFICKNLGKIAHARGVYLQTCILKKDYLGIHNEGCITPATIGLNIKPTKAPLLNNCMCTVHTYGIGDYNTCKGGCKYCYATSYVDKSPNIMESYLPVGTIRPYDTINIVDKMIVNTTPSLFDNL